jgi:hypothetical protein
VIELIELRELGVATDRSMTVSCVLKVVIELIELRELEAATDRSMTVSCVL